MRQSPPTRRMRENPDLEQLKRQAKELLQAYEGGEPEAVAEVQAHYHGAERETLALHHTQLVLARAYGFESWPKLKAYVDGVTVKRLADAVREGDREQVRAMLRTRPELANMAMSYGDEHRPLHFAVMRHDVEIVRLLMQHGADAHSGIHPHRSATTPMVIARERGYADVVAVIEEEEQRRTPLQQEEEEKESPSAAEASSEPAREAVAAGDIEWLKARQAEGKLINPITWGSGGLLRAAVRANRLDILRLLLEYGFDPEERVSYGEGPGIMFSQGHPLWQAAANGNVEAVKILLEYGANPNSCLDSSGTPVFCAFSGRHSEIFELLRSHGGVLGADIAALYRQTDLAKEMLELDARGVLQEGVVGQKRTLAEELLDYSCSGGDPEIVGMALERIDWPPDDRRWFFFLVRSLDFWNHIPWLRFARQEYDRTTYFPCFQQVLRRCDPNLVGSFGRTALHEVAAAGDHVTEEELAPFAKALLEAGCRTNRRDDILQSTPLGWACRWGRVEVVRLLLAYGADAIEPEADPWATPRAWATKMGHSEIAALLEQATR